MSGCSMSQLWRHTAQISLQQLSTFQQQQTLYQLRQLANNLVVIFNFGQRQVFQDVFSSVLSRVSISNLLRPASGTQIHSQRLFFLIAPRDTIKNFCDNRNSALFKVSTKPIIQIASSFNAAQLPDNDRTAHSALKIPILINYKSKCNSKADLPLAHKLCATHRIFWDEIVLTHRYNLKADDRTLRDICRSVEQFEKIFILFLGKFQQIIPVVKAANRLQKVSACFKQPKLYSAVKCLYLCENMRHQARPKNPNATGDELGLPSYQTSLCEGKLQAEAK